MLKKDRADIKAEELLEIQIKNAKRDKKSNIILVSILSILIIGFGIGIFIKSPSSFSEEENRVLQGYPKINLESILNGEFSEDIGSFYSDQFPFRNFLVATKAFTEISMLKMENNSVILAEDDYLIKRIEYDQKAYDLVKNNLDSVEKFMSAVKELGIDCNFVIAPRAIDVMDFKISDYYSS